MLQLTERERRTLSHDVPGSAKAYEFFLRANYLQRERTVENLVLVRDLYRACVEEDPNYAPAWARLGRCYRFLEKFGEAGPQNLELAQDAFHQAFALNPDLAIAHNLYTQIEADLGTPSQPYCGSWRKPKRVRTIPTSSQAWFSPAVSADFWTNRPPLTVVPGGWTRER